MKHHSYKFALIQSILSIVFSMIIWLVLFIGTNTPLVYLPNIVQFWGAIIAFSFSILGAIMAIFAKRNNILKKTNITCISAMGIIISAIDIIFFVMLTPIMVSKVLLGLNITSIVSIEYFSLTFTIGIVIDIILIVKYYRTKPIIKTIQ